jgi:molybdopterin molybdotransferase
LVPPALDELGVTVQFHKVQQRPGKPFWFGTAPSNTLVYALPGNPVSALTCFHRYTLPQLQRSAGSRDPRQEFAILNADIRFPKPLTLFPPVRIIGNKEGKILVEPVTYGNSGDLAALTDSDGFIELDAELETFPAGYTAPFYRWI